MYDVIALGELLIDFTSVNNSENGNPVFEANPGGAPCNVLAMLARLGKSVAFIGKVGEDMFGNQLKAALINAKIGCEGLILDKCFNTTLAFVQNKEDGDRLFSFYRTNGADTRLEAEEINENLIKAAKLFHFGSLSLTDIKARNATIRAIELAEENNLIISFDPNLRPALWQSMEQAHEQIIWGIQQCDILKLSEEELFFITHEKDIEKAAVMVKERFLNIKLLLITNGKYGSYAFYNNIAVFSPASSHKAIDTTGAGDTFFACCINFVIDLGLDGFNKENLEQMLKFASKAAGIITTRKGAMAVMPTPDEINNC